MRIAQISTLSSPVCESGSSSIEYLVWQLSEELLRQGHEVTVFAAEGSQTSAELVVTSGGPSYGIDGAMDDWQLAEWANICRGLEESGRFDVVHSHAYLWSLPLDRLSRAPMVHTMHVQPYEDHVRLWSHVPEACVTSLSAYQWHFYPQCRPVAIINHGVDPRLFEFRRNPDDYVAYLGRFTEGKGPEIAIETARTLGLRLLLAGPDEAYYRERIAPLVDGKDVQYVGFVAGETKSRFLGGARALLYPLLEGEPFGLVQVEAMMCGTPVAALAAGAVPEVIDTGITGVYVKDRAQFPEAVRKAIALDRGRVRLQAEQRFTITRMADEYLALYERLIRERRVG